MSIEIPAEEKSVEHIMSVVRDANKPREVSLREISSEYVNREIAVEGKAVAISDPEIIATSKVYVCLNCDEDKDGKRPTYEFKPKKCIACGEADFEKQDANLQDLQIIKITEPKPVNNQVAKIIVVCRGTESMWKVRAGQKIRAVGKLQIDPVQLTLDSTEKPVKRLEATELKILDNMDIKLTEADEERIREMVKDPLHFQILVESFAPHLVGLEEMKEVCIYTLGSCNSPRPFNSMLGGPPGRGKTQLLEWTAAMHPLGVKFTAAKSSMPGLTSITKRDPDTGAFVTDLGVFALYDGGIVCITELQAVKNKDDVKTGLNDALESKEVSSANAGGLVKFQARCALLCDTNSFNGGWDYGLSLAWNIKYMEPNLHQFISRLDLISISPESETDEFYAAVADSNFKVANTEEALEKFREDWVDENGVPHYGANTLIKYFIYVTRQPLPQLNESTRQKFSDNYVQVAKEAKEYTVDGRYNRAVRTVAQVRARLLLKPEADDEDLQIAIAKVNKGKEIKTKTEDGESDGNASLGLPTKKAIKKDEEFWQCFEKACLDENQNNRGWCTQHDINYWLTMTNRADWTELTAETYVKMLLRKGKLYEKEGAGKYSKLP